MGEVARGSRKRSQLRAPAGADECLAETLGVAGRSPDRLRARIFQVQEAFVASLDVKTAFLQPDRWWYRGFFA